MIEILYQNGETDASEEEGYFHIPRNIRQIGDIPEQRKIYVEDYVYTYLMNMIKESMGTGRVAILLGECKWQNQVAYFFIRGCFRVEAVEVSADCVLLEEQMWDGIYSTIKEHFSGQEVIGWFLLGPDLSMETDSDIYRTHLHYFGEDKKVLFAMDSLEKEENFYLLEEERLEKQKGYYIYYEKNEPMQTYMIACNLLKPKAGKEEIQDQAVEKFRRVLAGQNSKEYRKKPLFLYACGACLAATLIIVGVKFAENYEKMKSLEKMVVYLQAQEESSLEENQTVETQTAGNQAVGNQTAGNQAAGNQTAGNQAAGNQTAENQTAENQTTENQKIENQTTEGQIIEESTTESQMPENQDAALADAEPPNMLADLAENNAGRNTIGEDMINQSEEISSNANAVTYVVKKGDTLNAISKSHYGNIWHVEDICQLNDITPQDFIYPGQIILLP
jgi:LysM repeat protein